MKNIKLLSSQLSKLFLICKVDNVLHFKAFIYIMSKNNNHFRNEKIKYRIFDIWQRQTYFLSISKYGVFREKANDNV